MESVQASRTISQIFVNSVIIKAETGRSEVNDWCVLLPLTY